MNPPTGEARKAQRPSELVRGPAGAPESAANDAARETWPIPALSFRPDGSVMDLGNVSPSDIDFAEMANGLSKIARFNGRYCGTAYSDAQHCVMGADALFEETGDTTMAGYFLLHDGHEYLIGDIIRPVVALINHHMRALAGKASFPLLGQAIDAAKLHIDLAIWRAAGLAPIDRFPIYARDVAAMDERMLRAEALALFGPKAAVHLPAAGLAPPRLTGAIRPWGAMKAEEAFIDRLERYLGIVVR